MKIIEALAAGSCRVTYGRRWMARNVEKKVWEIYDPCIATRLLISTLDEEEALKILLDPR